MQIYVMLFKTHTLIHLTSCVCTEVLPVTKNLGLKFHPRSHFRVRARVRPLTHNTYLPPH